MSRGGPRQLALASLLTEERYRRYFCDQDKKRSLLTLAIMNVAYVVYVRNDLALLYGTTSFWVTVASKLLGVFVSIAAATVIARSRKTNLHDLAFNSALLILVFVGWYNGYTRLAAGEYIGPLTAQISFVALIYIAPRNNLKWRSLSAWIMGTVSLLCITNPVANITTVGRTSLIAALVAFNVVGFVHAQSFETERRKRFIAERDQKRTLKSLQEKLDELATEKKHALILTQARSAFLATMSHEFRTPMNAVIGLSELLTVPKDQEEYLRTIQDSARNLLVILNDILDFSDIDAGKIALSMAPFDLRILVTSVVNMFKPIENTKHISITHSIAKNVPAALRSDETRLRQVLVNLVSNAVKFSDNGTISLNIEYQDQTNPAELVIHVTDQGIGIPVDILPRLFQPFEQGDNRVERKYGGTGLGLAKCKQIIQALGGEISVQNNHDKGCTFSFSLPVEPAILPARSALAKTGDKSRARSIQILVVDDHPVNLRVAEVLLKRLGFFPDLVSSGHDAITAAQNKDYDVIFMDLQMPEMGGILTTKKIFELRQHKDQPKIVAMTASALEEDKNACKEVGMVDFITKPINIKTLDDTLMRLAG